MFGAPSLVASEHRGALMVACRAHRPRVPLVAVVAAAVYSPSLAQGTVSMPDTPAPAEELLEAEPSLGLADRR